MTMIHHMLYSASCFLWKVGDALYSASQSLVGLGNRIMRYIESKEKTHD